MKKFLKITFILQERPSGDFESEVRLNRYNPLTYVLLLIALAEVLIKHGFARFKSYLKLSITFFKWG